MSILLDWQENLGFSHCKTLVYCQNTDFRVVVRADPVLDQFYDLLKGFLTFRQHTSQIYALILYIYFLIQVGYDHWNDLTVIALVGVLDWNLVAGPESRNVAHQPAQLVRLGLNSVFVSEVL